MGVLISFIPNDKQGAITSHIPPILQRLNINPHEWLKTMHPYGNRFFLGIGRQANIERLARKLGRRWLHGISVSRRLFIHI